MEDRLKTAVLNVAADGPLLRRIAVEVSALAQRQDPEALAEFGRLAATPRPDRDAFAQGYIEALLDLVDSLRVQLELVLGDAELRESSARKGWDLVLKVLRRGPLLQNEVARELGLSEATVSRRVRDMRERGLIEVWRSGPQPDTRARPHVLSLRGEALAKQLSEQSGEASLQRLVERSDLVAALCQYPSLDSERSAAFPLYAAGLRCVRQLALKPEEWTREERLFTFFLRRNPLGRTPAELDRALSVQLLDYWPQGEPAGPPLRALAECLVEAQFTDDAGQQGQVLETLLEASEWSGPDDPFLLLTAALCVGAHRNLAPAVRRRLHGTTDLLGHYLLGAAALLDGDLVGCTRAWNERQWPSVNERAPTRYPDWAQGPLQTAERAAQEELEQTIRLNLALAFYQDRARGVLPSQSPEDRWVQARFGVGTGADEAASRQIGARLRMKGESMHAFLNQAEILLRCTEEILAQRKTGRSLVGTDWFSRHLDVNLRCLRDESKTVLATARGVEPPSSAHRQAEQDLSKTDLLSNGLLPGRHILPVTADREVHHFGVDSDWRRPRRTEDVYTISAAQSAAWVASPGTA